MQITSILFVIIMRQKMIVIAEQLFPTNPSIRTLLYKCQCIHQAALRTSVTAVFIYLEQLDWLLQTSV